MTEHGLAIAQQLLPQTVLFGLLFALLVSLNWPLRTILFTILVLSAWLIWLSHMLRRPATGQILLHWKRRKETREIISTFGSALLAILLVVLGLTHQPIDIEAAYIGLMFIFFVLVVSIEKGVYLSENGVETGHSYIRWEQIESYCWSETVKPVMPLFFKMARRVPIFNPIQFEVPYEQKAAVDEIVLRKVQHVPADSEKTALTS